MSRRRRRGRLEVGDGLLKKDQLVYGVGTIQGREDLEEDLVHKPRRDNFALEA